MISKRLLVLSVLIISAMLINACSPPAVPPGDPEALIQTSVLQTRQAIASATPATPTAAATVTDTLAEPTRPVPMVTLTFTPTPPATGTPAPAPVLGALIEASFGGTETLPEGWPEQLTLSLPETVEGDGCVRLEELQLGFEARNYSLPAGKAEWCVCGLQAEPGTPLLGQLTGPAGVTETLTTFLQAGSTGGACFHFVHVFPPDTPRQPHEFRTQADGIELVDRFVPWAGVFLFENWQPQEEVAVQVYEQESGFFLGAEAFAADEDGRLVIQVGRLYPEQQVFLVAMGAADYRIAADPPGQRRLGFQNAGNEVEGELVDFNSGAVFEPRAEDDPFAPTPTNWLTWCREGAPSQVYLGDVVQVLPDTPVQASLRRQPSKNARISKYLQPGDRMVILEGPKCILDMVWWYVEMVNQDVEGWLLETEERTFFVEPVIMPNRPENRRSNP